MFKRLMEWVKGRTYVTETLYDIGTFEGKIPAWMSYPEEQYRFQVWIYRVTTTRDAQWVSPSWQWRYVVKPMSKHRLPVDRRARTINVYEVGEPRSFETAYSAEDAALMYVRWIKDQRIAFEDMYSKTHP